MSNFFEGKTGLLNTPRVDAKNTPNQGGLTQKTTLEGQGPHENGVKNGRVDANPHGHDPVTTVEACVNPPQKGVLSASTLPQNGQILRQPSSASVEVCVNPPKFASTLPKNEGVLRQPWITHDHFPLEKGRLEKQIETLSQRVLKAMTVIPFDLDDPERGRQFWLEQTLKFFSLQNELDVLLEHQHLGMPYSRAAWRGLRAFPAMTNNLAIVFLDRARLYQEHFGEQSVGIHEGGQILYFAGCNYVIAV